MGELGIVLARAAPGGMLATLVVFAVLAVWRGWLVPRGTVDKLDAAGERVESVQAERLADSVAREREWKAAYVSSEEARRVQADQLTELLESARAVEAALRAFREAAP